MTDDWLRLEQARDGDESAWRALFETYYLLTVKMAYFITGSLESAKDIGQEAFVVLLRANIRHQNGSLKSFLSTIAYRLAVKERMRRNQLRDLDAVSIADDSASGLEAAVRNETDRLIVRTIQSLNAEQREILTLRFFGGNSYEDIARIMSIPVGTVKSRIFYAVKSCRQMFKEQGIER
jgi:RNA polymerase sigma-70 factor (ECF subfamily)